MNKLGLLRRIEELRLKVGLASERAVSVAAGTGPDFLRKIRTGQTRDPGVENLAKVAAVLSTTLDDLMEHAGINTVRQVTTDDRAGAELVNVVGDLQAGTWREAVEWEPSQQRRIALPPDTRFPTARRFGLELVGDSMNLMYPLPRTVVICVRLPEIDREPVTGQVVVVQRWRHDLVEATCKVYVVRDDGSIWLEPRSTNPAHKPVRMVRSPKEAAEAAKAKNPAVAFDDHVPDSGLDKVEISALVTGAYVEQ